MNKIIKKSIAVMMFLIVMTSLMTVTSAISLNETKKVLKEEEPIETDDEQVKELTVLRYAPDGTITKKVVKINLEEGQDIGVAIADKCEELTENDPEIQSMLKKNKTNLSFLSKIWSVGRGFHFKTTIRLQLIQKLKLFPFLPPYFRTAIFIPTNFCKYTKDPKAKTVIKPLYFGENQTFEGPHQVFNLGFIGYTGWIGHISFMGFIFRTGFAGFTALAQGKEL